jgi:conjugal transfer pilus assembly protein TraF
MRQRLSPTEAVTTVFSSALLRFVLASLLAAGAGAVSGAVTAQEAVDAPPEQAAPALVVPPSGADAVWFERDVWREGDRGFHYYPPERDAPVKAKPKKRDLKAITNIEELQAEVKLRRSAAIMDPSEANMKAYLEANTLMMAKSAMFADMWKRTVWTNPEFDYTAVQPTANFALADLKNARLDNKAAWMRGLSRDFGLVFFYRGDCPYCKLQAPVLQMLSRTYGVEVLPVSMDGAPIEGFTNARPDNGISMRLSQGKGVRMVPALYLVARETQESVLLGTGVMAVDEIVERVHVLTQLKPGEGLGGGAEAAPGSDVTRVYSSAQRTGARQ